MLLRGFEIPCREKLCGFGMEIGAHFSTPAREGDAAYAHLPDFIVAVLRGRSFDQFFLRDFEVNASAFHEFKRHIAGESA